MTKEKCCINLICEEVNDRSLVLYDSKTGDDFPAGKEYNEGEYIVFINKSGIVSVVHQSGAAIDEFSYGDFYGIYLDSIAVTIGGYPPLPCLGV